MSDSDEIDINAKPPPGYFDEHELDPWAEPAVFARLRAMTMDEKMEDIARFLEIAHRAHIADLARQFPQDSLDQLEMRAAEIRLGKEAIAALLAAGAEPPWRRK